MLKRLYVIISILLTAGFIAAATVSFTALSDFNRRTTEKRLSESVRLVSLKLAEGMPFNELDQYISETLYSDPETVRITLVTVEGEVVFDSETDAALMDDHSARPEIAEAVASGDKGVSIRKSDTLEIDTFYLAVTDKSSGYVIRAAMPMQMYESSAKELQERMILLFIVFALFFIITGIIAAKITAAPLVKLKSATDKMASGDYSMRIPVRISDRSEIAQLTRSFDSMAEKLEEAQNELINDNIRMDMVLNAIGNPIIAVDEDLMVSFMNKETAAEFIHNDFPESKLFPMLSVIRSVEAETLVRRAFREDAALSDKICMLTKSGRRIFRVSVFITNSNKGKAAIVLFQDISQSEQLAQMRTDFVASVTHELKTPLTSIRGFVDTLRSSKVEDPEVRKRFLDIIDVEAERLHSLISDILSLSEIEEMSSDNDITEFDINELIDEVVVLLDDEASQKHISVIAGQTDSETQVLPMMINANRHRIKQILINLVENAIRYNIKNGKVYIEAQRIETRELQIKVRDTGCGISAEHLPRIFERFYRVDKGRSRELGGTGLGLSIVKHIAMLYKGSVSAQSTPGEGTVISVLLNV